MGVDAVLRSDPAAMAFGSADAILICASSTEEDPIRLAARLARDRAPVVVVGDVKMNLPRGPFYDKEIDLRLSRSYGPGRYDPSYELHGHDYPAGYVRWTQRRNMEAFLGLVASGRISPGELVAHRFEIGEAKQATGAEVAAPGSDPALLPAACRDLTYETGHRTRRGRLAPRRSRASS